MPVITHLVSLTQPAGVEAHFSEFVRHARASFPDYVHGWLNAAGEMHPFIADRLEGELDHIVHAKRRYGLRLPASPGALRTLHCRRALAAAGTDVLLVWNRTARTGFLLDALDGRPCLHWEHGAAWFAGREPERREYLRRVPLAIANSNAAKRVLELLWDYDGDVRVCRNALRVSLVPPAPLRKRFPAGPIKLGAAARLFPVKGLPIVLHALAALRRTHDAELEIAGAGPELARLRSLADSLGLREKVTFCGAVNDMAGFFRRIHCLLHTPITEAFGLVAIEASAHGCPVIAAGVDGLAEAVTDGVTGRLVAPTLPLARYVELGGALEGMPQAVYDPATDALAKPRAVDPEHLAAAVAAVFSARERFEAWSGTASAHVLGQPDFAAHVKDVMTVVAELSSGA